MADKPTERKSYGLPRLTITEAARVLGIPALALMVFIENVVKPSDPERSMWVRGRRDLPEELIRLYLTRAAPDMAKLADPPPEQPPGRASAAPSERSGARRRKTAL